jgi:rhodanese-related sulfurtransferase
MANSSSKREDSAKQCEHYSGQFEKKLGGKALSFAEIQSLTDTDSIKQVILVDVRSPQERNVSIVKGALSQAEFEALNMTPQDQSQTEIVVYCTIGYRSGQYACQLVDKGWAGKVHNGQGVVPWSHEEGFEVVKNEQDTTSATTTDVIHVFGNTWDVAGPRFRTVTFSLWSQVKTFFGFV